MARLPLPPKKLKIGELYFFDHRHQKSYLELLKKVISRQDSRNSKFENILSIPLIEEETNVFPPNKLTCSMMVLEEAEYFGNTWVKVLATTPKEFKVGWIKLQEFSRIISGRLRYE